MDLGAAHVDEQTFEFCKNVTCCMYVKGFLGSERVKITQQDFHVKALLTGIIE